MARLATITSPLGNRNAVSFAIWLKLSKDISSSSTTATAAQGCSPPSGGGVERGDFSCGFRSAGGGLQGGTGGAGGCVDTAALGDTGAGCLF